MEVGPKRNLVGKVIFMEVGPKRNLVGRKLDPRGTSLVRSFYGSWTQEEPRR